MIDLCTDFHHENHGDTIDDLYHDCDVHHAHEGENNDCLYFLVMLGRT